MVRGSTTGRTAPSPDAAGPSGASRDSDTYTKERRNKDVRAGRPGMTTPWHGPRRAGSGTTGQPWQPWPRRSPTDRQKEIGKSVTQYQLEHEPDLGQARGARLFKFKSTAQVPWLGTISKLGTTYSTYENHHLLRLLTLLINYLWFTYGQDLRVLQNATYDLLMIYLFHLWITYEYEKYLQYL